MQNPIERLRQSAEKLPSNTREILIGWGCLALGGLRLDDMRIPKIGLLCDRIAAITDATGCEEQFIIEGVFHFVSTKIEFTDSPEFISWAIDKNLNKLTFLDSELEKPMDDRLLIGPEFALRNVRERTAEGAAHLVQNKGANTTIAEEIREFWMVEFPPLYWEEWGEYSLREKLRRSCATEDEDPAEIV